MFLPRYEITGFHAFGWGGGGFAVEEDADQDEEAEEYALED